MIEVNNNQNEIKKGKKVGISNLIKLWGQTETTTTK